MAKKQINGYVVAGVFTLLVLVLIYLLVSSRTAPKTASTTTCSCKKNNGVCNCGKK